MSSDKVNMLMLNPYLKGVNISAIFTLHNLYIISIIMVCENQFWLWHEKFLFQKLTYIEHDFTYKKRGWGEESKEEHTFFGNVNANYDNNQWIKRGGQKNNNIDWNFLKEYAIRL